MKQIPNVISVLRVLLVPVFVYYIIMGETVTAGVVLGISGITDVLDGWLARQFNWVTTVGKILDPLADKLTHITVSIVFIIKFNTFWPIFAVFLLKESLMIILVGRMVKKGVKFKGSKWFGKVATVVFFLTMVGVLFLPDVLGISIPDSALLGLFSLNLVLAVISALMYIPDYREYKKQSTVDS
ncbi:MAG: CDP-alcohol phosphatidyltransferase family protein [Oscillospiraceae bacterium]|nr:CDP-alcohol phosphatidyltransferase family protein [Oscillospiraceae bacterium]